MVLVIENRPRTPVVFVSTWLILVIPASLAASCIPASPTDTRPSTLTAFDVPTLVPTSLDVAILESVTPVYSIPDIGEPEGVIIAQLERVSAETRMNP